MNMAAKSTQTHYHTLRRHPKQRNIYLCTSPVCSFKDHKDNLIGKMMTCYICGKDYITTKESLRLALPHCTPCTKGFKGFDSLVSEDNDAFMQALTAIENENSGDGI